MLYPVINFPEEILEGKYIPSELRGNFKEGKIKENSDIGEFKKHFENCETHNLIIDESGEIEIIKGISHFNIRVENADVIIKLIPSNKKLERISINAELINSNVELIDISGTENYFYYRIFELHNSRLRNLTFLKNNFTYGKNVQILKSKSSLEEINLLIGEKSSKNEINSELIHSEGNSKSKFLHKSILKDNSHLIVNGKIKIHENARNSKSFQDLKSLMLSKNAISVLLPQLEIDNNEVEATHSASSFNIDGEKIFYLRAKGIDEKNAERMICHDFLKCELEKFRIPDKLINIENMI